MSELQRGAQALRLPGLFSFPLTPFDSDDRLDEEVFRRHVEEQITAAPAALFVACGTGEFAALGLDEYEQVVKAALDQAAGRLPVLAGAGGGPRIACDFARAAEHCGADGLLLLPPYLLATTPQGLVHHIRYVAGGTALPVVVYQRGNAMLDPAGAVALLDIDNIVGVKDGCGDIDAMQRMVIAVRTSGHRRACEFSFLNGLPTAEVSAAAYRAIGVENYSSAVHCFAPDIATAFHRALVSDDERLRDALLAEFYVPFAALRDRVPGYAVALVKAGARLTGLAVGPVRPPLIDATPEHVEELMAILDGGKAALNQEESRQ